MSKQTKQLIEDLATDLLELSEEQKTEALNDLMGLIGFGLVTLAKPYDFIRIGEEIRESRVKLRNRINPVQDGILLQAIIILDAASNKRTVYVD